MIFCKEKDHSKSNVNEVSYAQQKIT